MGGPQFGQIDSGCAAVDDDVGVRAQADQRGPVIGVVDVEDDAALAAVPAPERQRALDVLAVAGERTAPATGRTPGRLDEHDVGAEAGEDERGQVAAFIGEIDDAIGLQHSCLPRSA